MKTKEKVEQGKGTADHLMLHLGYLFTLHRLPVYFDASVIRSVTEVFVTFCIEIKILISFRTQHIYSSHLINPRLLPWFPRLLDLQH